MPTIHYVSEEKIPALWDLWVDAAQEQTFLKHKRIDKTLVEWQKYMACIISLLISRAHFLFSLYFFLWERVDGMLRRRSDVAESRTLVQLLTDYF